MSRPMMVSPTHQEITEDQYCALAVVTSSVRVVPDRQRSSPVWRGAWADQYNKVLAETYLTFVSIPDAILHAARFLETAINFGVLVHDYVNANDDPAAFDADQADRQGVTVAFAHHRLTDATLWFWRDADMSGDDPWTVLTGLDRMVAPDANGNEYIIEWGTTRVRHVKPDFRVFAQRHDLRSRGIPSAGV